MLDPIIHVIPSSMMNEFTNIDTTNPEPSNPEAGGPKTHQTIRIYSSFRRGYIMSRLECRIPWDHTHSKVRRDAIVIKALYQKGGKGPGGGGSLNM